MTTFKHIPLSNDAVRVSTTYLFNLLNEMFSEVSWVEIEPKLQPLDQLSYGNRQLLDVLHIGLDGHILFNDTKKKRLAPTRIYNLTPTLKAEIKKNMEMYENVRSSLAYKFIDKGYGEPTDYAHFLKLNGIIEGYIPTPKHMKKMVNTRIFKKHNIPVIRMIVGEITTGLYGNRDMLYINRVFWGANDKIKSFSMLGAEKKHPLDLPDHIVKATRDIIDLGYSKYKAWKESGITDKTFRRDWNTYKYPALINFLFDLAHYGKSDRRVVFKTGIKDKTKVVDAHITFTDKQLHSIKKLWSLKDSDLPNTVILHALREAEKKKKKK